MPVNTALKIFEKRWNKIVLSRNKLMIMENETEQGGKKMTNGNGNGNYQNKVEEIENKRLQKLLKKAVNTENAPETLRDRIRKMIRE